MILFTMGREFYHNTIFPLKVYRDLNYIPNIPLGMVYQIIIIEEGLGIIKLNQEFTVIHAPVVYLLNELEHMEIEDSLNLKIHIIYFHPKILNSELEYAFIKQEAVGKQDSSSLLDLYLLSSFLFRDKTYRSHYQLTQLMLHRLLYLKDSIHYEYEKQSSDKWPARGRSYFLEMLCYLSGMNIEVSQKLDPVLNFISEMFDEVLLYIHANYSKEITVYKLVETFHINRTTLNKRFRDITGESVKSYVIKLRIESSAFLLRNSNLTVKGIAYQVGYNDIADFGRAFRKLKGCNPKEYRKENKEKK